MLVGVVGKQRTTGFWGAFLLSLFFSPLLGITITLLSSKVKDKEREYKLAIEWEEKGDICIFTEQDEKAKNAYKTAQFYLNKCPRGEQRRYLENRVQKKMNKINNNNE